MLNFISGSLKIFVEQFYGIKQIFHITHIVSLVKRICTFLVSWFCSFV
ncbi:hypothetical protein ACKLNO_04395 [Neisseriaceae bacterium B1]